MSGRDATNKNNEGGTRKNVVNKPLGNASEYIGDYDQVLKKNTKLMIQEALYELKSKKGVSYYAIKKYISTNYCVNIDKIKHIIKKQLKAGVEEGNIVQMKGTGATGSFKLVQTNEKKNKKKDTMTKQMVMQSVKRNTVEMKLSDRDLKKIADDIKKSLGKEKERMKSKDTEPSNSKVKENTSKSIVKNMRTGKNGGKIIREHKAATSKITKMQSEKREKIVRRKSIGSIIKPPKMKPKNMK